MEKSQTPAGSVSNPCSALPAESLYFCQDVEMIMLIHSKRHNVTEKYKKSLNQIINKTVEVKNGLLSKIIVL